MWMSKYKLNIDSPRAIDCYINRNSMHQEVQNLFDCQRAAQNILYVTQEKGGELYIYIRSSDKPRKNSNVFDWIATQEESIPVREGQKFRFKLVCNPVKQKDGKRFALTSDAEIENWMQRQGRNNGFEIDGNMLITGQKSLYVQKATGKFRVGIVTCSGCLNVTDIIRFQNCLKNGIGKSLSYGCGLLVVNE